MKGPTQSCLLEIRAVPGSAKDALAGTIGAALKVKLRAPAVDGRANEALCHFLAGCLGLPTRSVWIHRGGTSRQKLVRIEGVSLEEAQRRLASA